jgi:hypothetical protein
MHSGASGQLACSERLALPIHNQTSPITSRSDATKFPNLVLTGPPDVTVGLLARHVGPAEAKAPS